MTRLVAVAALALAVTPIAGASAEGPRNRVVECTQQYVIVAPDARDYLWCLSLR